MFDVISALEPVQLTVLIIGAILIGINKTAIPGLGVLPVVMLTMTFETRPHHSSGNIFAYNLSLPHNRGRHRSVDHTLFSVQKTRP